MDKSYVSILESYVDFFYAREILDVMNDIFKKKCDGCANGYLSQRDHTCILSSREQLDLYFDDVLRELDETSIIVKWYDAVCLIDYIPSALVDMYKLKLDCCDWRETSMKSLAWKKNIIQMTITILHLETRFT